MIHITAHAAERFIERIDGRLTFDQAREAIAAHAPAIEKAAAFGCKVVKLGCGGRLVLEGTKVVTVLAPKQRCDHDGTGLPWDRSAAIGVDQLLRVLAMQVAR